jgi:hypothetical protein
LSQRGAIMSPGVGRMSRGYHKKSATFDVFRRKSRRGLTFRKSRDL